LKKGILKIPVLEYIESYTTTGSWITTWIAAIYGIVLCLTTA